MDRKELKSGGNRGTGKGKWFRGGRRLLSELASLYLESNTLRLSIFGMNMTPALKSDLFKFDLAHYYGNYVRIKVTF